MMKKVLRQKGVVSVSEMTCSRSVDEIDISPPVRLFRHRLHPPPPSEQKKNVSNREGVY